MSRAMSVYEIHGHLSAEARQIDKDSMQATVAYRGDLMIVTIGDDSKSLAIGHLLEARPWH